VNGDPEGTGRREAREVDAQAPPIVQALDTAFRYLRWLALLLAVLYLVTGITFIQPDEQAIVLTLGRFSRVKSEGLLLAWPYPIDEVVRVATQESKRLDVDDLWHPLPGMRVGGETKDPLSPDYVFAMEVVPVTINPLREGYCITGDREVLQAYVTVKYRVTDPVAYALGYTDPEGVLRNAVLAAVTRTLAEMPADRALKRGEERVPLAQTTIRSRIQRRLDDLRQDHEELPVITVETVDLAYLHPPRHVFGEFQKVKEAESKARHEQLKAEAERIAQKAMAQAETLDIITAAENYAARLREEASGKAEAFRKLRAEYRKSPVVAGFRMYREAMEQVQAVAQVYGVSVVPGGRATVVVGGRGPKTKEEESKK